MKDSVFIIRAGDEISGVFYNWLCIFHGDTESGIFDHGKVIKAVTASDHGISSQSDTVEKFLQRMSLINVLRHDLKEIRFGKINIE